MNDLLIQNGRIIDGTGAPAYTGSLLIRDGKLQRSIRKTYRKRLV